MRCGWIAFVIPFLFIRSPSFCWKARRPRSVIDFICALTGVSLICAAFAGYAVRPLSTPMRVGFGVAGLLLFIPAETMQYGEWTDIIGLRARRNFVRV